MFTTGTAHTRLRIRGGVVLLMLLIVAVAPGLLPARGVAAPTQTPELSGVDDSVLEVGVEWVNDYPGTASDLTKTDDDAVGLYNRLRNCSVASRRFTGRFNYGDSLAWEQDWKGQTKPGGGTEQFYIDTVDFAYFSGHGSSSGFFFGVNKDDNQLRFSDATNEWGNGDADWIGISACNVLDDPNLGNWALTMRQLRLIMGFKTVMSDVAFGDRLGQYLCAGDSFTRAWFRAANALLPSSQIARVLAEEQYMYYDRPFNHNSTDVYDNDYYWWTHPVGAGLPVAFTQADLGQVQSLPVYKTPPLSLDDANSRLAQLGDAFGVTTPQLTPALAGELAQTSNNIYLSPDGQLEFDTSSGQYNYARLGRLWDGPQPAAAGLAVVTLSQQNAQQIADSFLRTNKLLPGGAVPAGVVNDELSTQSRGATAAAQPAQTTITEYQVIYQRTLPVSVNGLAQVLPVVGPGSRLKVYVAATAPAGLAGAELVQESVIGAQGGYRSVAATTGDAELAETVPIISEAQALAIAQTPALEELIALDYNPVLYTSRQVIGTPTLGYYELPIGVGQSELIPVYSINVRYTVQSGEVVDGVSTIPAAVKYMAPLARIASVKVGTTVLQAGAQVKPGSSLTLEAADAAQTLAAQGFGSSLTFAAGSNNPDDYLYTWYLGSIADENKLGTGRTLTYVASRDEIREDGSQPLVFVLEVKNSAALQPPNTSKDNFQLSLLPTVYAPMIVK